MKVRFSMLLASVGGECRFDSVGASIGRFGDDVAGIVHDVGVVAGSSDELIGSGSTVERVVASAARYGIRECVAGADKGARAGIGEVLDLGAQRVAGGCRS